MRKPRRLFKLLCTAPWMICLLSGCAGQENFAPSSVSLDTGDGEWMTVSVKEAGKAGGTFILENCGDIAISYGDRNILEKHTDGQWSEVLSDTRREMSEPDYLLEPGASAEYETTWETLSEGDYRYVVPFRVIGEETPDAHYAAAEFTV